MKERDRPVSREMQEAGAREIFGDLQEDSNAVEVATRAWLAMERVFRLQNPEYAAKADHSEP
jgi:hypothetical protein